MGKVSINLVSKNQLIEQLDLKPSIADQIIMLRKEVPFKTKKDLEKIEGIDNSTLQRIQNQVNFKVKEVKDDSPADIGIGVDEDGNVELQGSVSLVPLIEAFRESSKKDKEKAYKQLVELWERWAEFVRELLRRADERGLDAEDIKELRSKIKKLRRLLKQLKRAVDKDKDDRAEELIDEIEKVGEQIDSLLED